MPLYLKAAVFGVLAASGLLAGCIVGLFARPARRVVAAVMAFGSGTLLSAIAFGLCENAYHHGGWKILVFGFLAGGCVFVFAEAFINSKGGFLRREGTRNAFLKEKKAERDEDILQRLSEVQILRSLPPAEVQPLVSYVDDIRFSDGQVVFKKGDQGDALYLVLEGKATVEDNGRTLATLGKGAAFGEMALLTGEPRNATVTASETLCTYRITHENFHHLMSRSRALADAVHRLLEERIEARKDMGEPTQSAETWRKVAAAHLDRSLSNVEEKKLIEEHTGSSAPVAIFVGALVDGIAESVVIGSSLLATGTPNVAFMLAVFCENFPEAMSSASGMSKAGFSRARILGMWCVLVAMAGVNAMLGNLFLTSAPPQVIAFVDSVAGGAILALLTTTLMPEAFEMGGRLVAFSTIVGFLTAFLLAAAGG